jgi:iron-sulfur cluster repair protein YtfE (RIC family)
MLINKNIEIEDLVRNFPFSVKYLMEHGIRCIACGEPIWGTLEEAAQEKGFNQQQIAVFVDEMNQIHNSTDANLSTKEPIIEIDDLKQ